MRYPGFLQKNGTIGFLAPSFGCATEPYKSAFKHSLDRWAELGFRTKLGPNCFLNEGVGISNTPQKCGEEVMSMFADPEAEVLISCGGGELMCEILDYVDFDRLRQLPPKWFMGYSDNTNLTFLLPTICDTASIYGPCAGAFGMEPLDESVEDAYLLLRGEKQNMQGYPLWESEQLKDEENPLAPYHLTEERVHKYLIDQTFIADGRAYEGSFEMTGRLLGGCVDCLVGLIGTPYDQVEGFLERYREDGIIWILESCDLNVFHTRRALWQMEQAGWFRFVKGFVFGRPRNGEEMMGLDAYQAVLAVTEKYHVPVVMDADIGHMPPMMPVVMGSKAKIAVHGNEINIAMNMME